MTISYGSPAGLGDQVGVVSVTLSHIDRPLAAILSLNTIAHPVGAAGVGAEMDTVEDMRAMARARW